MVGLEHAKDRHRQAKLGGSRLGLKFHLTNEVFSRVTPKKCFHFKLQDDMGWRAWEAASGLESCGSRI